jgi:hypothetical protein
VFKPCLEVDEEPVEMRDDGGVDLHSVELRLVAEPGCVPDVRANV